jgi:hypothetical protein
MTLGVKATSSSAWASVNSSRSTSRSFGALMASTGFPPQLELTVRPAEEGHEHGSDFLARPRCSLTPAVVDELPQELRTLGWLEARQL